MKNFFLVTACVSFLFLSGCAKEYTEAANVKEFVKKDPDAAGAVKAVRSYNKALIMAYLGNDAALLKNYATDRELNKMRHLIEGFISQNLRMEAELKNLRIEKIERWGKNNVVVTTAERWRYRRIFTDTGKEQKSLTSIDYRMRYNMVREDGMTWQLFDLSPV